MKPGYRTTELILTVLTNVGALAAALAGVLSPKYAALAAAISTACYSLSRGIAKLHGPVQVTPVTPVQAPPAQK